MKKNCFYLFKNSLSAVKHIGSWQEIGNLIGKMIANLSISLLVWEIKQVMVFAYTFKLIK